jgi:hypothetical protein
MGDIVVETWNNNVYDWVERPWSAANRWFILLKRSALFYSIIYLCMIYSALYVFIVEFNI